jgi:hypothetical protein
MPYYMAGFTYALSEGCEIKSENAMISPVKS